jgi:hypothetical protein
MTTDDALDVLGSLADTVADLLRDVALDYPRIPGSAWFAGLLDSHPRLLVAAIVTFLVLPRLDRTIRGRRTAKDPVRLFPAGVEGTLPAYRPVAGARWLACLVDAVAPASTPTTGFRGRAAGPVTPQTWSWLALRTTCARAPGCRPGWQHAASPVVDAGIPLLRLDAAPDVDGAPV